MSLSVPLATAFIMAATVGWSAPRMKANAFANCPMASRSIVDRPFYPLLRQRNLIRVKHQALVIPAIQAIIVPPCLRSRNKLIQNALVFFVTSPLSVELMRHHDGATIAVYASRVDTL